MREVAQTEAMAAAEQVQLTSVYVLWDLHIEISTIGFPY
jgi:hypothetical protein